MTQRLNFIVNPVEKTGGQETGIGQEEFRK